MTGELEVSGARSHAGDIIEERRTEVFVAPNATGGLPPIVVPPPPPGGTEVIKETIVRNVSPGPSHHHHGGRSRASSVTSSSATAVVVDARPREVREVSETIGVGPLALVPASHSHRSRSKSRVRRSEKDLVRAERLSTGELVLYEEQIERIEEPSRGVRIEKDKKGRMSISVPKYR
jgi:hypothetical protein